MRALWDEPVPSFDGRFVSFDGVLQRPRPVQRLHPPIILGGHSGQAYRRAVAAGNGWYGWDLDVGQTAASLDRLRSAGERPAGLGELEITVTPRGTPDVDTVRRYADLGVARLVMQPPTMDGTAIEDLITTIGDTLVGRVS